jgi:hypothetical protein
MKSPNEEFCKSKFDDFLKKTPASTSIVWQEGDEPPDYYLSFDDARYAVEVTILMEKLAVGGSAMPKTTVMASLWDFVDEVEQTAKERNHLHGTYIVRFTKPIDNFREVKDSICTALLYYIEHTQDLDKSPGQIVFKRGSQSCVVEKLHSRADRIHKAGPNDSKWEGEVATEICNLLEERLANKHYKLREIALPQIVLLYDSYHFADQKMYKDTASKPLSAVTFHTVFIVQSDGDGFVLHSENMDWL